MYANNELLWYCCYAQEILEMGKDWNEEDCRPVTTIEETQQRCVLPKPYHVPMANIPLYISDDFYIPVNIHNLVKYAFYYRFFGFLVTVLIFSL